MCGEHAPCLSAIYQLLGSSPHVRGTRALSVCHLSAPRFIPACAGNTPFQIVLLAALPVHPRMCGEHPRQTLKSGGVFGSSPHVRGTLQQKGARLGTDRFIPACAGNTPRSNSCSVFSTVHPRMCGEHGVHRSVRGRAFGSSPHVRGTLEAFKVDREDIRFIPACAGNTSSSCS